MVVVGGNIFFEHNIRDSFTQMAQYVQMITNVKLCFLKARAGCGFNQNCPLITWWDRTVQVLSSFPSWVVI
jgi:hypothetical protein